MDFSHNFKKFAFSGFAFLMIAACAMPINKVEARGEGAVAVAAGVGALVGAAIASDVHHKNRQRQCYRVQCCMAQQQQIMNYVLMNYNPAFHDSWVRYVVVDCSYTLNPTQQNQLISVMNQRRDELGCGIPVRTIETHVVPGSR